MLKEEGNSRAMTRSNTLRTFLEALVGLVGSFQVQVLLVALALALDLVHQAFVLSSQVAVFQSSLQSLVVVFPLVLAHHHERMKDMDTQ